MGNMITRNLEKDILETIAQRRSFFLFGPRQTGKTTLLDHIAGRYDQVLKYSFLNIPLRQKAEQRPEFMRQEIEAALPKMVVLDEVQKVPEILDEVQYLIDKHKIMFLITGSSARKLRRKNVNLLAGRAITYRLDPFDMEERSSFSKRFPSVDSLKDVLTYGDLPEIALLTEQHQVKLVENLLRSYVETFLEEEIRMELLIRKVGLFGNFLRLAAEMSGKILSFRELSQDLGVTHHTISSYYTILHDCLIIERIPPLIPSSTRRRLSKSHKYLFFDIGVRNAAAHTLAREGINREEWSRRFEEWIGLSLLRYLRSRNLEGTIYYWRDHNGPEIDWIVEYENRWIPVEVKFLDDPLPKHIKHLETFMAENEKRARKGFVIFLGERPRKLTEQITALPWFELQAVFE
jgi:predicted AAA+ superfamily ATPase